MTSMWVLRWVLVALSAALAVALIVHGNVIIGVLIGAMALTRAVIIVQLHTRREELRRRFAQRRASQ